MKKQGNQESRWTPLQEALIACRSIAGYVLLFGFICNFLSLSTSLYSMQVLDRVLSSQNMDTLLMLTIAIVISLAILSLIQGARSFASNRLGMWFEHLLSPIIFRNTCRMGAGAQQLRDLQTIKNYLISPHLISMMDIPWSIIFVIVAFLLHTYIGCLALIGGVLIVIIGIISDKYTTSLMNSSQDEYVKSMEYVNQATRNSETMQAMGLFPNIFTSWQKINKNVQSVQELVTYRQAFFNELSTFVRTVVQISVTCVGAYLVVKNDLSSGGMIASSTIVGKALQPFQTAIVAWKNFIGARKAYNRVQDGFILGLKDEEDKMSLPDPLGTISVENVSYYVKSTRPDAARKIIDNISCNIEAGSFVVVMGPSGSGKTTLIKLLVGAINAIEGIVRIDSANVIDWNKYELGSWIGYLGQEIGLFDGTIRENIARMDQNANSDDIIVAAKAANVHEMILRLPDSYDTRIGMGGIQLSGGQKQRIALARAFYGKPRILVLDEPNANLDMVGDEALYDALSRMKQQSSATIVVISHKPNLCSLADYIMLLDFGKLVHYMSAQDFLSMLKK